MKYLLEGLDVLSISRKSFLRHKLPKKEVTEFALWISQALDVLFNLPKLFLNYKLSRWISNRLFHWMWQALDVLSIPPKPFLRLKLSKLNGQKQNSTVTTPRTFKCICYYILWSALHPTHQVPSNLMAKPWGKHI